MTNGEPRPIYLEGDVVNFKGNPIVKLLLEEIKRLADNEHFWDRVRYDQLIFYSVDGAPNEYGLRMTKAL